MAVGSYKSDGYSKVELLQLSTLTWFQVPDYPFGVMYGYAAVTFCDGDFYVFGGNNVSSKITRLGGYSRKWTDMGEMVQDRNDYNGHGVIFTEGHFLVVGGSGKFKTEKCTINGDKMNCVLQDPELAYYKYYAELVAVEADYCQSL